MKNKEAPDRKRVLDDDSASENQEHKLPIKEPLKRDTLVEDGAQHSKEEDQTSGFDPGDDGSLLVEGGGNSPEIEELHNRRIWCVEDDLFSQIALRQALGELVGEFRSFKTLKGFRGALEHARALPAESLGSEGSVAPDLIVADIFLGVKDNFLNYLKDEANRELIGDAQVILVTAYGDDEVIEQGLALATDVISKPFNVAEIRQKAERLLLESAKRAERASFLPERGVLTAYTLLGVAEVNPAKLSLRSNDGGVEANLTAIEFKIVAAISGESSEVPAGVCIERLMRELYGEVNSRVRNSLSVNVGRLRKKLNQFGIALTFDHKNSKFQLQLESEI